MAVVARRPVPPELAEWQPIPELAARIAAVLPSVCAYRDDGAPWRPTAAALPGLLGWPQAWEARVTGASEQAGVYYLDVAGRDPSRPDEERGAMVAATSRSWSPRAPGQPSTRAICRFNAGIPRSEPV